MYYWSVKCQIVTLIVAIAFIVASITTWIAFPHLYPAIVKKELTFAPTSDEGLSYSAFMLANPPMRNVMKFIFFNITNAEELKYEGAKPRVYETGAYAVIESEQKRYTEFSSDNSEMFYENYKTYIISDDETCDGCNWDDVVTIPNPVEVGAAADVMDPQFNISHPEKVIIATLMILVGEYPFITKRVRDIIFDGYNDPMLSIAHSKLVNAINYMIYGNSGKSIIPIPAPAMHKLGFLIGYNNSNDESFWIKTGKDNIDDIGKVTKWGNVTELPGYWWTSDYARSIRGSDSGSFSKWHLKKTDHLEMFYSFMCRSFNKEFLEETTVEGIPAYRFSTPYEDYDSTLEINRGFRYRNFEHIDYYPGWPNCPEKNASRCDKKRFVDCSVALNFCDDCCEGSLYNSTYFIPPGIFPLVCYPGKLQPTPFSVMYSPPHFLYSPQQVIDSVYGMNPDPDLHRPFLYDHEPYSGQVMQVRARLMVSTPMMRETTFFHNTHLPNVMFPIFYQSAHAKVKDVILHKLWLGFVFIPKFVDFMKYLLLTYFCVCYGSKCDISVLVDPSTKIVADERKEVTEVVEEAEPDIEMSPEQMKEKLKELYTAGKKDYYEDNFEKAADSLAEAAQLADKLFGQKAGETFDYYLYYGRAELEIGREENILFRNAQEVMADDPESPLLVKTTAPLVAVMLMVSLNMKRSEHVFLNSVTGISSTTA
ncbi:unnamed protein product, partial [Mesorhabditis belari]|uniref:Plant heme peroxidase family profile domain-containing protein n=1 Tax=Mesorhabditis belari TaxID=2138241 RepID=A0AAF3ESY4_9BILA